MECLKRGFECEITFCNHADQVDTSRAISFCDGCDQGKIPFNLSATCSVRRLVINSHMFQESVLFMLCQRWDPPSSRRYILTASLLSTFVMSPYLLAERCTPPPEAGTTTDSKFTSKPSIRLHRLYDNSFVSKIFVDQLVSNIPSAEVCVA
jgi:hypothetical protein